jgi:Cys-tRNA(Pro) deacylase
MAKVKFPVTPAVRFLKQQKIAFDSFIYQYEEKGGTQQTASDLNLDHHSVVKTIVLEDDSAITCIVLQHGDKEISTKSLAREIGCKKLEPCEAKKAGRLTGYQFGGTSPFGTVAKLKVYAEESIFDLDKIYINGGKRGYIIGIVPLDLEILSVTKVSVAV